MVNGYGFFTAADREATAVTTSSVSSSVPGYGSPA
jgi:hypothetical protein